MKRKLSILILLLATFQIYSQEKISKGVLAPYSGVILPIDIYRYIRIKSVKCDSVIALKNESAVLKDSAFSVCQKQLVLCDENEASFNRELAAKEETITSLFDLNEALEDNMNKMEYKKPFYNRPETWFSVLGGFIIGILIR